MLDALKIIEKIKIVPVVVINDAGKAEKLALSMTKGNIPVAEVTFRTAAAAESIAVMKKTCPEMLVGAGTIINVEQAKKALSSGAEFIVSPGFSESVADFCKKSGVLYVPGCVTPTEIMAACEKGLTTLKFFPAGTFGGVKAIKALAAPFGSIRFMPTGGVNAENLKEYLSFEKIVACGGSWMVDAKLIENDKFDEITDLCREAKCIADSTRS